MIMDCINEQIKQLIDEKKTEKWFSERKLAAGICSHGALTKIKTGASIRDPRFLIVLLQRLGKSANKLELIVPQKTLKIVTMQSKFDDYIDNNNVKSAGVALDKYYEIAQSKNSTNIEKMYYWRNKASYYHYCNNDIEGALDAILKSIEITIPGWRVAGINQHIVSTIELENVLEYLYCKSLISMRDGDVSTFENIMGYLMDIEEYISKCISDDEEKAVIIPKCKWVKAVIYDYIGKPAEVVMECKEALIHLQRYAFFQMLPGILDLLVKNEKNMENDNEYSFYNNCREALIYLINKEKIGDYKWNALLIRRDRILFHCDSCFIAGQRRAGKDSQDKISEMTGISTESISRIETGKSSPTGLNYALIMSALGINAEKHDGVIQTTEFSLLEKTWSVCVEGYIGDLQRASEILCQVKREMDTKSLKNRAMIKYLEDAISISEGNCDYNNIIIDNRKLLEESYLLNNKGFYRVPLFYEFNLMLSLAIAYNKTDKVEEAERFFKAVIDMCEGDGVDVNLRQRIYGVALYKYAYSRGSIDSLGKAVVYEMKNRSFHWAYKILCAYSCIIYKSNKEEANIMLKHSYWLSLLAGDKSYSQKIENLLKSYY